MAAHMEGGRVRCPWKGGGVGGCTDRSEGVLCVKVGGRRRQEGGESMVAYMKRSVRCPWKGRVGDSAAGVKVWCVARWTGGAERKVLRGRVMSEVST